MSQWVDVGPAEKIGLGQRATLIVDGIPVVVFNVGGAFFALEDECSHAAYPLSDGEIEGEVVTCVQHGARFSLRTGEDLAPPACEPVATYPVRVNAGRVEVSRKPNASCRG
jgi:3-phenylpropionate/trans-cinnamate dioxygenase ferredoxin subunit